MKTISLRYQNSFSFLIFAITLFMVSFGDAFGLPAFARKYESNCVLCHSNEPRLNPFGQQFKENGYQMPGTSDGGTTAKHIFEGEQGPVTVDDISKMMAVRIRADVQRASFNTETTAMKEAGVGSDFEVLVPKIVNLFFAGTAKEDLSYYTEIEYNSTEGDDASLKFERAYILFNNLPLIDSVNAQIGVFDPSGLFSFPTHRQQFNPIFPIANTSSFPPQILRIPLIPLAFSTKIFGLTKGPAYEGEKGYSLLPFAPTLYNAPAQTGLAFHGRPGGHNSAFMYQVGVALNDKINTNTTKRKRYDTYIMGRFDWATDIIQSIQISAFYYQAPSAAIATLNMNGTLIYADESTDIRRFGLGARAQWESWDIYGAYIIDQIDRPIWDNSGPMSTMAASSIWLNKGLGMSLEVDYRMTKRLMLAFRYDRMSPGGLQQLPGGSDQLNINSSFLSLMTKYYTSPNIGLYLRGHFNLESNKKDPISKSINEHPATNFRGIVTAGVDMAF